MIITACRRGWTKYGGSCFIHSLDRDSGLRWGISTMHTCKAKFANTYPVSIHSPEENDFVLKTIKTSADVWIGMERFRTSWGWKDGTPIDYTNWDTGHPTGDIAVGFMLSSGIWRSAYSYGPKSTYYICKYLLKGSVSAVTSISDYIMVNCSCPALLPRWSRKSQINYHQTLPPFFIIFK